MSELDVIQATLEHAAQRRRWIRAWNGFWRGLFVGALLWVAGLIVYKLAPVPKITLMWEAGAAFFAAAVGFLWGWLHKPSLEQTARWVDHSQHLHERLSTALELSRKSKDQNWESLLVADAAKASVAVPP